MFKSKSLGSVLLCVAMIQLFLYLPGSMACRCGRRPDIYTDYREFPTVVRVVVKKELKSEGHVGSKYLVSLKQTFKGCDLDKKFVIYSPGHSCSFGPLKKKRKYVLYLRHADLEKYDDKYNVYDINLCGPHSEWSHLSKAEKKFLRGREYSCDDFPFCAGSGSPFLRCATCCPPIEDPDVVGCELSTCRGCGPSAAYVFDKKTYQPVDAPLTCQ